jgi:hypothetical protein
MTNVHNGVRCAIVTKFIETSTFFISKWKVDSVNSYEHRAAYFGVKLARPGFGPPAEPAASSPA